MDSWSFVSSVAIGVLFQWWGPLLAIVLFTVLVLLRRAPRWHGELFTARLGLLGALGIAVAWGPVQVVAPYLSAYFSDQPWAVRWWILLPPVIVGVLSAVIALVRILRQPTKPEVPTTPVTPRHWLSFSRRRDWISTAAAFAALLALSIAAGLASSQDENGLWSRISIAVGDTGSGSSTFFGWAYSVPLLIAATALLLVVAAALRSDAGRPFLRPETVKAETEQRRNTSAVLFGLAGSSVVIGLSDALRMVALAGFSSVGVGIPDVGTFMYSTGFASIAPALLVIGSVLQAWATLWLLLTMSGRRLSSRRAA